MPEEPREPVKKAKKELKAAPVESTDRKAEAAKPTPKEIRAARKAQLVTWAETYGLDSEGKVDDLRSRLIDFVGKTEEKKPAEEPEPAKAKPKAPEKAAKPAKGRGEAEEPEEELHVARRKPKLDDRMRALLQLRADSASRRPAFRRQEWFRYKRLGEKWRKPQGGQSKLRRHFGYRWNIPSIGYRGPRAVRGLHPSGFHEVLVHTLRELDGLDPAKQAVRIAHGVGTRKREVIEKACDEREIRVLNRMVTD